MSYWLTFSNDRLDRFWAMGASLALHATLLLFFLSDSSSSSLGQQGATGNSTSLYVQFDETTEFHQPIFLASPSKQSDELPSLSAANLEGAPDKPANTPMPAARAAVQPASLSEPANHAAAQSPEVSASQPTPQTSEAPGPGVSPAGSGALAGAYSDDDNRAAYFAALRTAIQSQWTRNTASHGTCTIRVVQTIGGNVTSVKAEDCELDDADRMALEAAALMAQPLPYAGYESAFTEQVVLELFR